MYTQEDIIKGTVDKIESSLGSLFPDVKPKSETMCRLKSDLHALYDEMDPSQEVMDAIGTILFNDSLEKFNDLSSEKKQEYERVYNAGQKVGRNFIDNLLDD